MNRTRKVNSSQRLRLFYQKIHLGSTHAVISQWYAQPSRRGGHQIQYRIDPHHIFVNNRAKVCSSGLNQLGVRKEAWVKLQKL